MKKRFFAILLILALATVSLLGCTPSSETPPATTDEPTPPPAEPTPEAKIGEGRTLVVGIWGAEQEEIVREHLIPDFEEITGATVELVLGGSSDRYALVYSELDNPSMDVVYLSMAQTEQANADGVIQPANPEGVPNYNDMYDIAKQSGGYGVSMMAVGMMYSTETFPTPPTSWKVMWEDAYKGKVAPFVFPGTQGTAFLVMAARVFGGGEENIDPGFEALAQLKPLPAVLSGIDETNLAFETGDVVLAPQIGGYVYSYIDAGGKVGFTLPEEGGVLSMNCAAIPKNSKNTDLAEIWINLHLDQKVQQAYAEVLSYGPTNSKIELSAELAERCVYGEEDVSKLIALKNSVITENQAAWAERWNKEIIG